MPLQLFSAMQEKELGLVHMMRINGIKVKTYLFFNYLYNLFITQLTYLMFHIFGIFLQVPMLKLTSFFTLQLILLIWANIQVTILIIILKYVSSTKLSNSMIIINSFVLFHFNRTFISLNLNQPRQLSSPKPDA